MTPLTFTSHTENSSPQLFAPTCTDIETPLETSPSLLQTILFYILNVLDDFVVGVIRHAGPDTSKVMSLPTHNTLRVYVYMCMREYIPVECRGDHCMLRSRAHTDR